MSYTNNQDWKPIVINNANKKKIKPKQVDHNFKAMVALDNSNEVGVLNKVSEVDRKLIINLRMEKKISQENLAKRLSIRKETIRDIENGSYNENKSITGLIINYLKSLRIPNDK